MKSEIARKLLEKVKLDYDAIAYEFSRTRKTSWDEFEMFKDYLEPQMTVADIGCGNGRLIEILPENTKYIGIDTSKNIINEARKLHPNDTFKEGSLLDIPISSNTTDVTFCIATLPHIPSKKLREKAIDELIRITKPGGTIVISVWNLWQLRYLGKIIQAIGRRIAFGDLDWNDLFIEWDNKLERYYHAFTKSELRKLLEKKVTIEKICTSRYNTIAICKKK